MGDYWYAAYRVMGYKASATLRTELQAEGVTIDPETPLWNA
jgi:hypothetical protein